MVFVLNDWGDDDDDSPDENSGNSNVYVYKTYETSQGKGGPASTEPTNLSTKPPEGGMGPFSANKSQNNGSNEVMENTLSEKERSSGSFVGFVDVDKHNTSKIEGGTGFVDGGGFVDGLVITHQDQIGTVVQAIRNSVLVGLDIETEPKTQGSYSESERKRRCLSPHLGRPE